MGLEGGGAERRPGGLAQDLVGAGNRALAVHIGAQPAQQRRKIALSDGLP